MIRRGIALGWLCVVGCSSGCCGTDECKSESSPTSVEPDGTCAVTLTYEPTESPDGVSVSGSFDDWKAIGMSEVFDGFWHIQLQLPPGAYPYRFVESWDWTHDTFERWTCDPTAPLIHCETASDPRETWTHACAPGESQCNSLLLVADCTQPSLELTAFEVDGSDTMRASIRAIPGSTSDPIAEVHAELDGVEISGEWRAEILDLQSASLVPTRHTLRITASDSTGRSARPLYVPFWTDAFEWTDAVMYHAMVDRVRRNATSEPEAEGASTALGDYMGGDWAGLSDMLPYLADLGVNVIWVSNPIDNPPGAFPGQCGETFTGYHGYWPAHAQDHESHLGNAEALATLIAEAHSRNMRVLFDWVGNHVHQDHPYYIEHPQEWFNQPVICNDVGPDGQSNWDRAPETCWFADYLPDIDYTHPDALVQSLDDAVAWVQSAKFDGMRVDAAKHMPHSVHHNLRSRIRAEIEHDGAAAPFLLMGETFDSADRIAAYIGPDQLHGQFDFPLFWAIRAAFATETIALSDLLSTARDSRQVFAGATMSNFLGNLDVPRFVTEAAGEGTDPCPDDTLRQAVAPSDSAPYDALRLAWTFLLTQPGIPLIYYGDEIGMPGYGDPDNRHPMWWYTDEMSPDVDQLAATLPAPSAEVLRHVAALTQTRADVPALRAQSVVEWWAEDDIIGYARTDPQAESAALVVINRSHEERTLKNGLTFVDLPADGTFIDALSGEVFIAADDQLTVTVPARDCRILVNTNQP